MNDWNMDALSSQLEHATEQRKYWEEAERVLSQRVRNGGPVDDE